MQKFSSEWKEVVKMQKFSSEWKEMVKIAAISTIQRYEEYLRSDDLIRNDFGITDKCFYCKAFEKDDCYTCPLSMGRAYTCVNTETYERMNDNHYDNNAVRNRIEFHQWILDDIDNYDNDEDLSSALKEKDNEISKKRLDLDMAMRLQNMSLSQGTQHNHDLIQAFSTFLYDIRYKSAAIKNDLPRDDKWWDSEDARVKLKKLLEALNEIAPACYYFGSHPDDESNYGFWIDEKCAEEKAKSIIGDTLVYKELRYYGQSIPDSYTTGMISKDFVVAVDISTNRRLVAISGLGSFELN